MNNAEKLFAVISELEALFADKAELRGLNDWDAYIGCLLALKQVANDLNSEPKGE